MLIRTDLVAHLVGLTGELLLQLGVAHDLGVVLERLATRSWSAGGSTELSSVSVVKDQESVASMIAPANASPNESPNEPAAEFTAAASLTRSSVTGERV